MSENEFINVFRNGFGKEIQQNNSEVQCFLCLEKAYTTRKGNILNSKLKVSCNNGHTFELIDFLVQYANMIEGVKNQFLLNSCAVGIKEENT